MATLTILRHVDDLERRNGQEVPAQRVDTEVGLDGKRYVLDLSEENYQRLMDELQPFVDAARLTGRVRTVKVPHSPEQSQAIRAWAAEQGVAIANRGRIPAEVVEGYRLAKAGKDPVTGTSVNGRHRSAPTTTPFTPIVPETPVEPEIEPEPTPEPEPAPRFATRALYLAAVRAWAAGKGVELSPRGRVPKDVMDQHARVHGEPVIEG